MVDFTVLYNLTKNVSINDIKNIIEKIPPEYRQRLINIILTKIVKMKDKPDNNIIKKIYLI